MLTIDRLNQFYAESHTLWDLDLEVPAGQCTCAVSYTHLTLPTTPYV